MLNISAEHKKEHLYLEVYHYYRKMIMENRLLPGSKMPSLRKCAQDLKLSRTTIENAYLQLAADGYIIARPQSGYYVTDIARKQHHLTLEKPFRDTIPCVYDFASSGVDRESFRFDLWQRYIKSALRQDERMLSYGEPQGEKDFREVLSDYVRERRNVICSPDDIVVGAGLQSLLQILCPLIHDRKTVSFPTPSFIQCSTVFEDYGFDVHYRNKNCDVIYVSPAHMTKWGEIMPVKRRLELIRHAETDGHLIIEDDFENEFVYLQKPTPSLFGLAGGENEIYIGSFSRLLLPSIRVSFMVLPPSLRELYIKKAACYNQTASKAEQIALCQFIRDGHLASQVRKSRKIHLAKAEKLADSAKKILGKDVDVQVGAAGFMVQLTFAEDCAAEKIAEKAKKKGMTFLEVEKNRMLLTCAGVSAEKYEDAMKLLRECTEKGMN